MHWVCPDHPQLTHALSWQDDNAGAGPRKCIGYRFALEEAVITMAQLYRRFTFRYWCLYCCLNAAPFTVWNFSTLHRLCTIFDEKGVEPESASQFGGAALQTGRGEASGG
jgi:hypothetical protein